MNIFIMTIILFTSNGQAKSHLFMFEAPNLEICKMVAAEAAEQLLSPAITGSLSNCTANEDIQTLPAYQG